MAEGLVTVAFDQSSIAAIERLVGAKVALDAEMAVALDKIGTLLIEASVTNTWTAFQHPTGALASSIGWVQASPLEGIVVVGVPYAWRLEAGYHGTDSIGRAYNNEAEPYVEPAMEENQDQIMMIMHDAVGNAFGVSL